MDHQQHNQTNHPSSPVAQKFRCAGVNTESQAQLLVSLLKDTASVTQVDINQEKALLRIVSEPPVTLTLLQEKIAPHGFTLTPYDTVPEHPSSASGKILKVQLTGTTCRSCEITIEREWRKVKGVAKVDVNAVRGIARIVCGDCVPDLQELQSAIAEHGYTIRGILGGPSSKFQRMFLSAERRLSFWQLAGLFALVLFLGTIFSRFGFLQPSVALGAATSVGAVFLIGLVAPISTCIDVTGGLLLSSAAKFNARLNFAEQNLSGLKRMQPVIMFVGGRLLAYTLFGGLIGVIGKALTPSPLATGALTFIAALAMLVMGLDMLHLAPPWLKLLIPRLPKRFSHAAINVEKKDHPSIPFILGGATFFLPCGFTTALQLYILTTGSALTGASILGAFALGTTPALLALGWASSSLKGKFGRFFFQFSGALVVMLGFWNIQNGFAIAGYPLSFPSFSSPKIAVVNAAVNDPNVQFDGRTQTVTMSIAYTGYAPNRFTLRKDVPTRWVIDAKNGGGCLAVLQAPRLGIRRFLQPGMNTIEFTPTVAGRIPFSCSMGMFRGEINVVASSG